MCDCLYRLCVSRGLCAGCAGHSRQEGEGEEDEEEEEEGPQSKWALHFLTVVMTFLQKSPHVLQGFLWLKQAEGVSDGILQS